MENSFMALFQVVLALLDYAFKAVVSYKDTEEGAAEWLDIIAAYEQVTGDVQGAQEAKSDAAIARTTVKARPTPSKINLND